MTRATLARLFAAMIVLTIVQSVVLVSIPWFGTQGSKEAQDIDLLFNIMIVLSSFVFAVVMVMFGYAIWKFRAKPGDEGDGEPIHGNTRLEIAWTVIPTVIVLFAAAYSAVVLADIGEKNAKLTVDVTAQQFEWSFDYKTEGVKSQVLHVPVDERAGFRLHALDVLHSFWVPEWRMKKDAVPGITTQVFTTPDRVGQYSLVCTELCGFGHSTMRAKVIVEPRADFDKWIASQKKAGAGGATAGAPEGGS